jgi:hypothetical protein
MSAADIIAGLTGADQKLDQARAQAMAAVQHAAEARTLVVGALEGVSAGQLVSLIGQVIESLRQAAQEVDPAKKGIQETIARVRALGN